MKHFFWRYRIFFGVMIIISVVAISLFYNALNRKSLPVFNPAIVNPELVDTTVQHVARNHTIADFSFVNQDGKEVTQADYEGKIYVADFFFTTCQTICPKMTANMGLLQKEFENDPQVKLLSHSVMPEIDNVQVLKKYAVDKQVNPKVWNLVTGDKREIYGIARKSYLAVKTGDASEMYDMVHTENFVLVDQKRRVRGFYDGTSKEDLQRLIEDIRFLKNDVD